MSSNRVSSFKIWLSIIAVALLPCATHAHMRDNLSPFVFEADKPLELNWDWSPRELRGQYKTKQRPEQVCGLFGLEAGELRQCLRLIRYELRNHPLTGANKEVFVYYQGDEMVAVSFLELTDFSTDPKIDEIASQYVDYFEMIESRYRNEVSERRQQAVLHTIHPNLYIVNNVLMKDMWEMNNTVVLLAASVYNLGTRENPLYSWSFQNVYVKPGRLEWKPSL